MQASTGLTVLHTNDFESGLNGWTAQTTSGSGTWRVLTHPHTFAVSSALNPHAVTLADSGAHLPAAGGTNVAWFGDSSGTFIGENFGPQSPKGGGDSNAVQSGNLTSPPISLAGVPHAVLSFDSWWEIEGVAAAWYDLMQVYVSANGGPFQFVGQLNPNFAVAQPPEAAYSSGGPAAAPVWRHYSYDLSAFAGQTIQLRFRFSSEDAAYNAFRGFTVDNVVVSGGTALPAPTLTSVTPAVVASGDLVTVEGSNFLQGATFFVGNQQISPEQITQFGVSSLIFQAGGMAPGTYDIRVLNRDGQQAMLPQALTWSGTPSPELWQVDPNAGSAGMTQSVTLLGTNFLPGATVLFGDEPATNVNVVNGGQVQVTAPMLASGTYNVTVINPSGQGGTFYAGYTVADQSQLTVVTPSGGEFWSQSSTQTISWTATGTPQVGLDLFRHGAFVMSIAASVPAQQGSFSWTVPASVPAAGGYRIRVYNAYGSNQAFSTGTFEITSVPLNAAPVAHAQSVTLEEDGSVAVTLTGTDPDGDALTFTVLAQPQHGTLSGTPPALTYTPAPDFHGQDQFTFRVSDGQLNSGPATVTLTVTPVNDAPVAHPQSVTTAEDTQVPVTLSAFDVDGDPLTWVLVAQPQHGTLSGTPPALTYTPAPDFHGQDPFTFRVNDGQLNSNVATVSITVTPVNDAPVAHAQAVNTPEDSPVAVTLTAFDVEGDPLTWVLVAQPQHGILSGTPPALTYTPAQDFHGQDPFTFRVSDGQLNSGLATVTLTVTPVNDAPVAHPQSVTTAEDTPVPVTLSAFDVDGDPLTWVLVAQPQHGTLSGTPPALTYTPAPDFHGQDPFTFRVSDGQLNSNVATVSITVTPVNDAPVAHAQTVTTAEDTPVTVTLTAFDVEGDPLTWELLAQPQHGTVSGTPPALTYTPAQDFHGQDPFTFRVSDGSLDSNIATVSITVTPVNDAPVAHPQSVTTAEDTPVPVTLSAFDVDGDPLTWVLIAQPQHGTLSGTPPALTFAPAPDFHGQDQFTFRVNDGSLDANIATVSIIVTPVNDAPVAHAQTVTAAEDTPVTVTLSATDVDGDPLTWVLVAQPQHGTLSGTPPALTYTPAQDFHGQDPFTFRVNDGQLDSNIATVSITVTPVNDAPVAHPQAVTTAEDTPVPVTLSGFDVEGATLTFSILDPPAHGTLSGTAPDLTYTPDADFHGADSFTFRVNDGSLDSNIATMSITVTPVNDAPVAHSQTVNTDEDTPVTFTLTATDVDGDTLVFELIDAPDHGTLSGTPPTLVYTPAPDYQGQDRLTFRVNDGVESSNVATVTLVVHEVNDAPVAHEQESTTDEDVPVAILLEGTDVEGDPITFHLVRQPDHGTLSGTPPQMLYTPNADFHGMDSFDFRVNDGQVDSAVATVSITVNAVNDAPVALPLSVTTPEDTPVEFTLAGTDVDGDALTFEVTQPARGTLTGTPPQLRYEPVRDFVGTDTFTFRASDGQLPSAPATVTIEVGPVNDAPVAESFTVTTDEDTPVAVTLRAEDVDGDALEYTVLTQPRHGTLTGSAPNLTYTPAENWYGTDSFTFRASDGQADSEVATVTLEVRSVDDPPVAEPQYVTVPEDMATDVKLHGSDVEGAPLTFVVVTPPEHGTLTGTAPNLVYRPSPDYSGEDRFTFKVTADGVDSEPAEVSITVLHHEDTLRGGGVGCSATGAGSGLVWVLLSGAAALGFPLRRRRMAKAKIEAALACAMAAALPFAAHAQPAPTSLPRLEAEALRFNPGATGGLTTETGAILEQGRWRLGMAGHYEYEPLVYFRDDARIGAVIKDRATAHLTLGWAPLRWLEVGGQFPLVFSQRGDDLSAYGLAAPSASSFGTPQLQARAALWQQRHGAPVDFSMGLAVGLPLGADGALAREEGMGLMPRASAGRKLTSWLRVGAEAAVALRPETSFDGKPLRRDAVEGALVAHTVNDGVKGELSWRGALPLGGGRSTSEVLAGVRAPIGRRVEVFGLGGVGLGQALGTPTFRFVAGVGMPFGGGPAEPVALPVLPSPEPTPGVVEAPVLPQPEPLPEPESAPEPGPVAEAEAVRHEVVDLNAHISETLGGLRMFDPSGPEMKADARAALDEVVELMRRQPRLKLLRIEGHTCSSGTAQMNMTLSEARAESVRGYLLGRGISADQIQTVGYGSQRPVSSNATPEGRERNRRVEIRVVVGEP